MKRTHCGGLLLGAVVSSSLGVLPRMTLAQQAAADVSEGSPLVEEVVVTGTSIRGIAPVGAAPIAYGRAEIEAAAPVDVRDAMSNVPQISNFGTDADVSTSNRFRTSGYQPIIHNLGIYSTLTLFNGHRMADVGGEAVFPDPSILPTIAVERVEVIADGASAIYGSDAVAGVVNFIYRRNVNGFEVSATKSTDSNTSWENSNFAALWGSTFDSGEIMVAYEYSEHIRPKIGEFSFGASADQRSRGGSDNRVTTCEYPRVNFDGENYSGPNLAADDVGGTYRCSPNVNANVASNGERHAVLATGRYAVSDTVELWTELNYSDYKAWRTDGWGNGGRFQFDIPSTSPIFADATPPGVDPTGVTSANIRGDGVGVFGLRHRDGSSKVMGLTAGADIDLGGDWQANIMLHKSKTDDWNNDPGLDLQNMRALAVSGAFNPFDLTGNDPAVLAQINNGFVQLNDTSQRLTELSVKADGPVFAVPGGSVRAAIGASYRGQRARQIQSAGCEDCSFYQVVRDDDIERGVNAVFVELAVPVVGNANAIPGFQEVMLSFAGRYDDYDNLPAQFNPKVGLSWTPIDSLSVHGSWGTSYVAPNMGLITSIFGVPQTGIRDRIGGTNYDLDIYNLGGGNPALEAEEAESHSFGFTWAPDFVDGLVAGVTYYNVEYSNLIYKPTRADVLQNPAFEASRELGVYDPVNREYLPFDQAYIDQLIANAPPQTPILPGQTFNMSFNSFAINLGTRVHAGYDFNVRYDFDTGIGKWGVGFVANKQTKFDEEVVPGSGFFSRIGAREAPPWQSRYEIQWGANELPLRVTLVSNYKSGYEDAGDSIDSYLVHNLTLSYEFENLLGGVTLQGRVRNVTGEEPPFFDAERGYDEENHTPYGRQFDLTVRARF